MADDLSGDFAITFTETVQYEVGGPGKGPIYEAGETHSFRDDIARRWLRRNVAVVSQRAAPKAPTPIEMEGKVDLNQAAHDGGRPEYSPPGAQMTAVRGRRNRR